MKSIPLARTSADASHGLTAEIIYGPVTSRRYGLTYGVNLLPPETKRCDWNCVYCQLGYSEYEDEADDYPTVDEVAAAMRAAPLVKDLAGIVVCGNGEPTLHPRFADAAAALRAVRDERFPGVPMICLTNGAEVWRRPVRQALKAFEEVAVKLDAGSCEMFHRVNLPIRSTCVEYQIRTVKRLEGAAVQSCFMKGAVDNTTPEAIEGWIKSVARAMPRRVDVYTISRSPPSAKILPVPEGELEAIAHRLQAATGIPARAFAS